MPSVQRRKAARRLRPALRLWLLHAAGRLLGPLVTRPHQPPTRVLVLRPDHVGDVLLSAPAVALLRTTLPAARLSYLVGPWSAATARQGPSVDEVRTLAYPAFTRAPAHLLGPYVTLVREAWKLRRERFDMAVVLRADHWWGALLALAAGIPIRVGGATPETRPLLSHTSRLDVDRPWGDQALAIARLALHTLGAEASAPPAVDQFRVGDAAREEADAFWRRHGLVGKPVIALHPAAGMPLKSWPAARWTRLAERLLERRYEVLLIGAPDDAPLLQRIGAERGVPTACGQSLETSAAMYLRCELVVTVDSGAGHLAAAVGTRTVRLYGPAPPAVFGPWPARDGQRVLMTSQLACAPCGFLERPPCGATTSPACMLAVDVDDVLKAIGQELGRG